MLKFDFETYMKIDLNNKDILKEIENIKIKLNNDPLTSWFNLDKCINKNILEEIIKTSNYIKKSCDVFIVIGAGGSVLGSRAVIDSLSPYLKKDKPKIIYLGTSLSSYYLKEVLDYIKDKEVIINVISKSGSTLETNLYFNIIEEIMKTKYSDEELKKRIIITTDKDSGPLSELIKEKNYKSFIFPSDIGGRYATLTVVGLLPIAVSGINIKEIINGATELDKSKAFNYAVIRHLLNKEKVVESFTIYEPKLDSLVELIKQLMAESQGKNQLGILPISSINTGDLHSMGQYYQEGNPILFETVINIEKTVPIHIKKYNKTMDELNNLISYKVAQSHYENTTYSNIITLDKLSATNIGALIYFMEIAAATGAYFLKVNPFDQPGVNEYKKLVRGDLNE